VERRRGDKDDVKVEDLMTMDGSEMEQDEEAADEAEGAEIAVPINVKPVME
jgi:hypothetical protein